MSERPPSPRLGSLIVHFASTVMAVWLGGVLAGGTLYYLGRSALEEQLNKATEMHRKEQLRLDEEAQKRAAGEFEK